MRAGVLAGGDRTDQRPPLTLRQPRLGRRADQGVPEQSHIACPLSTQPLIGIHNRSISSHHRLGQPVGCPPASLPNQGAAASGVNSCCDSDPRQPAAQEQPAGQHAGQRPTRKSPRPRPAATHRRRHDLPHRLHQLPDRRARRDHRRRRRRVQPPHPPSRQHTESCHVRARRNQPRTVPSARPSRAASERNPAPPAAASSATPIVSVESARRTSTDGGSSTCVTPQPRHRARRGRTTPSSPRTRRALANPHGAKTCPHRQASSPTANPCSITTSLTTITTGALLRVKRRPSRPAKTGRAAALQTTSPIIAPTHPHHDAARHPSDITSTNTHPHAQRRDDSTTPSPQVTLNTWSSSRSRSGIDPVSTEGDQLLRVLEEDGAPVEQEKIDAAWNLALKHRVDDRDSCAVRPVSHDEPVAQARQLLTRAARHADLRHDPHSRPRHQVAPIRPRAQPHVLGRDHAPCVHTSGCRVRRERPDAKQPPVVLQGSEHWRQSAQSGRRLLIYAMEH